jgi:uncharacterized membrane protein
MVEALGPHPDEARETARLEAFSDGVIAIAITLLILHIPVPHLAEGENLGHALLAHWPSFLAFVVSFLTILIMWLHHHTLFQIIRHADRGLLALNGLLLLMITFVNYPTAVVAEYAQTPQREIAAIFYSGTLTITAIVFNILWRYASNNFRLLDRSVDPAYVQSISHAYRFGPAFYFAAFLVAFLNAWASLAINAGLAVYFAFTSLLRGPNPRH